MPALGGVALQPAFVVKLDGPASNLGVTLSVQSTAGQLEAAVRVDAETPQQSVAGDVSLQHVDLAPITGDPRQKSDITAHAKIRIDGEFRSLDTLRGTVELSAPRIAAGGYSADRIQGRVRLAGRRLDVDASGAAWRDGDGPRRVTLPADGPGRADLHGKARTSIYAGCRALARHPRPPTSAATTRRPEPQARGSCQG